MRKSFESEIQQLKDELVVLGNLVEQQLLGSVEAFRTRDIAASKKIIEIDDDVNAKRFHIEEQVLITIATQQPMARDLRLLASILEIAGELERMGDYAKGIAKINIRMGDEELLTPLVNIPIMAKKCVSMLDRAVVAFINEDVDEANVIPTLDDEIDNLYNLVYTNLMGMIGNDEKTIQRANWILWVAHNLERVADRVTNICERTIFTVTGELKEIRSSDQ
jgi:phosphate transport system protein